ncbi:MAG: CotH kinase family protein, partial [Bacteroidota bacterium]|nr:CotH kinase family protein [Bacteroidota bacterium]
MASNQLTNLPTIYINTDNHVAVTSKDVYVKGMLQVVADTAMEKGLYYDSVEIRGRGNSSWNWAKKPYRLKLADDYHLLGMPAGENSWVLLANYADKTLMRNALAFKISQLCGMYFTSAYRYVDLVLNGKSLGNYMVTDQMERGKHRVNIEKLEETDTELPNVSGGYLLEVDGFGVTGSIETGASFPEAFTSKLGNIVSIKYPKDDEIVAAQRNYIINQYNLFEQAVMSFTTGKDSLSKLTRYLDVDAFANWYIATELTANPDCLWSIYLKKHRNDDRFYFGPLWDNDISFGNCNRLYSVASDGRAESVLVRCFSNNMAKTLVKKILTVPEVQQRIADRWKVIKPGFKDSLYKLIDTTAILLDASQKKNYQIWPVLNTVVYNELAARGTYAVEVSYLRSYTGDRVNYLDGFFTAMGKTTPVDTINDPGVLFYPQSNMLYYLQCQNDKYLMSEAYGNGYRLTASTTLPADLATAQFEVTYTKTAGKPAYYFLRNKACNKYVYFKDTTGSVWLDATNKTTFELYVSPNEANHYGLMAVSSITGMNGKGIDCNNGSSVVIWPTANKKGQREYQ